MSIARVSWRMKRFWLPALLVGLFMCAGSGAAQVADYRAVVSTVTTQDAERQLTLRMNFSIQDTAGSVVSGATPSEATIHLDDGGVYPALLSQAEFDPYIVLLLDTSGSMAEMSDELRAAALAAVAAAPEGSRFAVLSFAEGMTMALDFTDNRGEVENAIAGIEIGAGSTCLVDTAVTAVQSLQQVSRDSAQRALILLTDGRDELTIGQGDTCSQNTVDDLIALARNPDVPVPIHTVALSNTSLPLNLELLEVIANETGSLVVSSEDADLSGHFGGIMAGLTSEWQAQANVYTTAGQHEAALFVSVASGEPVRPGTATFISPRDYDRPADALAPVSVAVSDFQYDRDSDDLSMTVDLTNPRSVGQVRVEVWNRQTNERVYDFLYEPGSGRRQTVTLETEQLTPQGVYTVRAVPLDRSGVELLDANGRILLAEHPFQYAPDPRMVFETNAVRISPEQELLVVDLNIRNAPEVTSFSGRFIDQEDNIEVSSFGPIERVGNMVFLPVPEESGSFEVIVNGQDEDGNTLGTASYVFRYTKPTADLFTKGWQALQDNTLLWVAGLTILALVMIVEALVLWALFRMRMRRALENLRAELTAAGPVTAPVKVSRRRDEGARIVIVQTMNPRFAGQEMEIKAVPFLIGREDCALTITGDRQISREHASINLKDGQYTVTDLRSSNGTYLDDVRLNVNEEAPLYPDALIRLGQVTQLRFVHAAPPPVTQSENGSEEMEEEPVGT